MNSAPDMQHAERREVAIALIKEACEQIGRTDEHSAPEEEKPSRFEQESEFHGPVQQKRPTLGRPGRGGIVALFLAACVCLAVLAWQLSSHSAGLNVGRWASQQVSQLLVKREAAVQPSAPALDAVAPAAPISSELATQIQTLARDLAGAEQRIRQLNASQEQLIRDNAELAERLKATQEQLARDNAAVLEQIKAGQAQMARDFASFADQLKAVQTQITRENANSAEQLEATQEEIARTSEQNLRPRPPGPPPLATFAPRAKPVPTPNQARAQPQASKSQGP
ncbi:MAG: hypothetical protein HY852_01015 [Bradyrhizobium sp.]|uniref:hypothetical protein n=1 Tax=Bradyrhizobium sp. TaxID=376 RepID=UPI0025BE44D2|nr:hypothetical protein [Bradyrhizobium sp.]MBI5260381.1 hypothetical protein [Bradyrhizobium sp.]